MKAPPTILQAMSDPDVFGRWFMPKRKWFGAKRDSFANWRIFLAVLFGLPLTEDELAICKRFTGRDDMPAGGFKEIFAICGRRAGKSLIAALVAVYISCFVDHSAVLMPGESAICMVIASDKRQARVILNYVVAFLMGVPLLKRVVKNVLKESVELVNGITIEIHTADYRAVRGFSCISVVCDETSFWGSDSNGVSPDVEILNAVRPSLATTNGLLLCISSPWARHGVMFDAFKNYYGHAGAPALCWKASSRDMNPTISQVVVAAAYARDFTSAKTEFGGEFRTDIEGFLSLEAIEQCIVSGRLELPRIAKATYSAFADPAGGSGADSFTLAIAHDDDGVAILDVLREVHPPFSPEQVVGEYAALLKSYGISSVTGDKYASGFNTELWQKAGIEYEPSDKNRSQVYLELLPILTSGKAQLLDVPRLKSQLLGLERKVGRNADLVDHGPGQHDDLANSCAGALSLIAGNAGGYAVLDLQKSGRWAELLADGAIAAAQVARDVCGRVVQNPRRQNLGKKKAYEYEASAIGVPVKELQRNMSGEGIWKAEKAPPCPIPTCRATCTIFIAGGQCRCQQCAHQWWMPGRAPEVLFAARDGGFISRRLQ